jgi:hypothetical protein
MNIASRPSGTLTQNSQRHDIWSETQPPTSGPAIDATAHTVAR